MSDLMRDPKSGRILSRLETEARAAAVTAEGHGLPKDSQQLIGLQHSVGNDSPAVQSYVQKLVDLVRDFSGPAVELKNVLPMLKEVNTFADKDKTLSAPEKRRIDGITKELTTLINKKTSLFTRSATVFKHVARKGASKLGKLRDATVDAGENSDSMLFKLGAKALARRDDESNESEEKNILQTRADVLNNLLGRTKPKANSPKVRAKKPSAGRPMTPKEFQKEPEFPEKASPKKRQAKEDKDDQSALLTHILDTERDVLTELKTLTKTLRNQTDEMDQERDEQARRDERQLESLSHLSPKQVGKNSTPTDAAKEDGNDSLLKRFGLGGLGESIKTLLPALGLMGKGASIIGAAWAGWEVGAWIAKMVGLGDSSAALAALLDQSKESYSDSLKSIGKGVAEGFKRITGIGETEEQKAAKESAEAAKRRASAPMPTAAKLDPNALGRVPSAQDAPTAKTPTSAPAPPQASTSVPVDAPKTPTKLSAVVAPPAVDTTPKKSAQMEVSPEGLAFIQEHEGGFQAKPYQDNDGSWTVGYGSHTFKGKSVNEWVKHNPQFEITKAEADEDMRNRLNKEFLPVVRKSLTRNVSQQEFDALASIAWNRGVGGKSKRGAFEMDASFLAKVNAGTATKADFRQAHGRLDVKTQKGIESRRGEEFALYTGDTPKLRRAAATTRDAAPITSLSASNKTTPPVTVVAPQIVTNNSNKDGGGVVFPFPIRPKNAESTFRAIQTINEM